jgi:hypothetical protein
MSTLKVVRSIIAEGLYPNTKTRVDGSVPIRLYHGPGTAPRVIMPNTFSLELRYFDTNLSRVACHLTMLRKIEPVLFFILSSPPATSRATASDSNYQTAVWARPPARSRRISRGHGSPSA